MSLALSSSHEIHGVLHSSLSFVNHLDIVLLILAQVRTSGHRSIVTIVCQLVVMTPAIKRELKSFERKFKPSVWSVSELPTIFHVTWPCLPPGGRSKWGWDRRLPWCTGCTNDRGSKTTLPTRLRWNRCRPTEPGKKTLLVSTKLMPPCSLDNDRVGWCLGSLHGWGGRSPPQ